MAKTRTWIAGIGCLVLMIVLAVVVLSVIGLRTPGLPDSMILSLRFDSPMVEIAAPDPFAELAGETQLSYRDLRTVLLAAADDDAVQGIRMRIDCCVPGVAYIQELRALLDRVRAAGKWTEVYLETIGEFAPGNAEYYLASGADAISVGPMADVNLIGFQLETPFFRGTLDKLGIKPEFPGRGDYKTARFTYTHTEFTPAHREMMEWLLGSLSDEMVGDIAASRGLEADAVRNLIDQAPLQAADAVEAGLVDRIEDWDDFTTRLKDERAPGASVVSYADYLKRVKNRQSGPKIAVVTGVGAIMRGENRRSLNPLFGGDVMGSETISRAFRAVRRASGLKAVVFRVDSPGGSAVASETIRREVERTAADLPVVVSMASYAASGGYWISSPATRIVADPATLTASIGVFAGHLNMQRFFNDKLGITFGDVSFGRNADIYGSLADWTGPQREEINAMLDRIYDGFLERVASGRGMTTEEVDAMGRGRVFTGQQAIDKGLVDAVGGFDVALDEARRLAGLEPGAPVRLVDYPTPVPWWQRLMRRPHEEDAAVRELGETLEATWQGAAPDTPGVAWMPPIVVR